MCENLAQPHLIIIKHHYRLSIFTKLINEIYKKYPIFKNLTITLLRNTQILFVFLRQIYKTIC